MGEILTFKLVVLRFSEYVSPPHMAPNKSQESSHGNEVTWEEEGAGESLKRVQCEGLEGTLTEVEEGVEVTARGEGERVTL